MLLSQKDTAWHLKAGNGDGVVVITKTATNNHKTFGMLKVMSNYHWAFLPSGTWIDMTSKVGKGPMGSKGQVSSSQDQEEPSTP